MKLNKIITMLVVLVLACSFSIAAQEDAGEDDSDNGVYYVPLDDDAPLDDEGTYDDGMTDAERDEIRQQYTEEEQEAFMQEKEREDRERRGEEPATPPPDRPPQDEPEFDDTEIEYDIDPGILPDSPLYFIDEFFEKPGDDPEKALQYKEEKMAEALAMARKNKAGEVKKALGKASDFGEIVKKEVTPDMKIKVKQSSQDIERKVLNRITDDVPELGREVTEMVVKEGELRTAAEVASKIKDLCQTLSELDPAQYEQVCKTGDDAPKWQIKMHQELSGEQREHAEVFADKMKQCMETEGQECDCEGMGVQSFVSICERASENPESIDPDEIRGALPEYLQPLMGEMMAVMDERMREMGPLPGMEGPPPGMDRPPFDDHKFMMECKQTKSKEECDEEIQMMKGPPDRIQEFGRDCHALSGDEKLRCFEEYYEHSRKGFEEGFEPRYERKQVPPPQHPDEWMGEFVGASSSKIKDEANRRGFLVEQMHVEEGMIMLRVKHENGEIFVYESMGDFQPTQDCINVGALSPSACRKHSEESGAWKKFEQDKLDTEEQFIKDNPECAAAGALSPEACDRHQSEVAEAERIGEEDRRRIEETKGQYDPRFDSGKEQGDIGSDTGSSDGSDSSSSDYGGDAGSDTGGDSGPKDTPSDSGSSGGGGSNEGSGGSDNGGDAGSNNGPTGGVTYRDDWHDDRDWGDEGPQRDFYDDGPQDNYRDYDNGPNDNWDDYDSGRDNYRDDGPRDDYGRYDDGPNDNWDDGPQDNYDNYGGYDDGPHDDYDGGRDNYDDGPQDNYDGGQDGYDEGPHDDYSGGDDYSGDGMTGKAVQDIGGEEDVSSVTRWIANYLGIEG